MGDHPGDTEDKYCSRCKRTTRHTCFTGKFWFSSYWQCDDCGKTR